MKPFSSRIHRVGGLAAIVLLGLAPGAGAAVVNVPVADGGTLTATAVDEQGTPAVLAATGTSYDNLLAAAPSGYHFAGLLSTHASTGGWYYADYLVHVQAAVAESVTTTLTNVYGGINDLSERIYTYGGAFLGDAAAPGGAIQKWSTDIPLSGASVSIVSPTALVSGDYVMELRGHPAGGPANFGGTLSLTPVPEPEGMALLALAFVILGMRTYRLRDQ